MNFNISPIAFYSSRAAQAWRAWFYQRKICVCVGENLPAFIINDAPTTAPDTVEIYNASDDTLVATRTGITDILAHTSTLDGVSVNSWIYQGTSSGIFGFNTAGYYYLKIGSYYSDIIKLGEVVGDYVKLKWQFYDDIITVDGTLISKYVEYQQIFETDLWHPSYNVSEEGKENNGVFFATQQTTKKTCGFSTIVNEAQVDCLNLTRMADYVQIEARVNGVVKSYLTNTFEIKSKWESDDVAHIECEFDLFNIIRKYQISNEKPEPLPIPTPPEPPANYYIRGTVESGTNSVQFKINGTNQSVSCVNGEFVYAYNSALTSFETAIFNNGYVGLSNVDKIKTLDLSESCLFKQATTARFGCMPNCTSINFGNCTFENVVTADAFCFENAKLTTISIPQGTFASLDETAFEMFADCTNLTSVSLPASVQEYGAQAMFAGCTNLSSVSIPNATFASTEYCGAMFAYCTNLTSITLTSATFASVTYMENMFKGSKGFYDEDYGYQFIFATHFPACTAQPTTIGSIFENAEFTTINIKALDLSACDVMRSTFENSKVRDLYMDANQFDSTTDFRYTFKNCALSSVATTLINSATFANATNCKEMFAGSGNGTATSITFDSGTFASVTSCESMFEGSKWQKIKFKRNVADFSNCTTIAKMYYNCPNLNEIDMAIGAHFSQITDNSKMANLFGNCPALVDVWTPQNQELYCSISLTQSPLLTYDAIVSLCMWMADLTGLSPKILYLNSTAYNNLSSAEKNNILTTYLQPKNWSIIA